MSLSLPVEWWLLHWVVTYSSWEGNGDPEEKDDGADEEFDGAGCALTV